VGVVFAYGGQRPWMSMTVDQPGLAGWVTCELTQRDGTTIRLGTFQVTGGYGVWAVATSVQPSQLAGARLVGPHGETLAHATF
jgi:hypothetical protein